MKYEQSINQDLRKYILGLLENDDRHRTNNNDSLENVKWIKVIEQNGILIDSIIYKIGFPGEHLCGIFGSEIVLVNGSKDYPTGIELYPCPSRIFYHSACAFQNVKNELLQAINVGELTPKEYALIYEWSYNTLLKKADGGINIIKKNVILM